MATHTVTVSPEVMDLYKTLPQYISKQGILRHALNLPPEAKIVVKEGGRYWEPRKKTQQQIKQLRRALERAHYFTP